jgi:hypothetical protein
MTDSDRFLQFKGNIALLRQMFLPAIFVETGIYEDEARVQHFAIAFRLLAHAEIESFIEDRADALFQCAWRCWNEHRTPSRTILALIAHLPRPENTLLENIPPATTLKKPLSELVQKAQSHYRHIVRKNHGIRKSNILKLLVPLGFEPDNEESIPLALLTDLDAYGVMRGSLAHQPRGLRVQVDPRNEWQTVEGFVAMFKILDERISKEIDEINLLQSHYPR